MKGATSRFKRGWNWLIACRLGSLSSLASTRFEQLRQASGIACQVPLRLNRALTDPIGLLDSEIIPRLLGCQGFPRKYEICWLLDDG